MAMPIPRIIEQAKRQKLRIRWVVPDDCVYDQSRKIANARFSYRPAALAYCETAESVASLFQIFKNDPPKLRIRSGGHQHEGMCSADKVLLVDLSKLARIGWDPKKKKYQELDSRLQELWVQPGVPLGVLYHKLEPFWKTLPAGGCGHVNIGGLVQGGGWGLSLRKFGLTCDNLLEVEIVLADGRKVFASETQHPDLFWAIRGGGGGNFGVITNFKLKIYPLADTMTSFRLEWGKAHRLELAQKWMEIQNTLPNELTTFGRISVLSQEKTAAFILGGQFYGSQAKLEEHLQDFFDIAEPKTPKADRYKERRRPKTKSDAAGPGNAKSPRAGDRGVPIALPAIEAPLTSLLAELVADLQPGAPLLGAPGEGVKAPTSTCSAGSAFQPHPHKISSAFPNPKADKDPSTKYNRLAKALVDYVDGTPHDNEVNLYVSLHGFGGRVADIKKDATAFPYRHKDFLLQFQAWWSDPGSEKSEEYVKWIEGLRKLEELEGAFINFPDISLVDDKDEQRVELLEHYYAGNLPRLRDTKSKVDPKNVFSFGMSIPLP